MPVDSGWMCITVTPPATPPAQRITLPQRVQGAQASLRAAFLVDARG